MGDGRNVQEEEEAPFPLTDTDKWVLSQTDEQFQLHDWDELKEIIGKIHDYTQLLTSLVSSTSKADCLVMGDRT